MTDFFNTSQIDRQCRAYDKPAAFLLEVIRERTTDVDSNVSRTYTCINPLVVYTKEETWLLLRRTANRPKAVAVPPLWNRLPQQCDKFLNHPTSSLKPLPL